MGGCDVVDLWCALVIVHLQVNFDCGRKRGLSVLPAHDPKHFAVLPQALCVNEAENHGQNGKLKQFQLESVPKLAGW